MLTRLRASAHLINGKVSFSRIGIALSLIIVIVAAVVLYRILRDIDVDELVDALEATDWRTLGIAGLFVAAGYLTLTFYDLFALRTIGRSEIPYRIAALASFTSYAVGHNVGASVFSGGAVRYRIYSSWGLSVIEVTKICFVAGLTFWLGNATVLGLGVLHAPQQASDIDQLPIWLNRVLALAALAVLTAYVTWVWVKPRVIGRDGWQVTLPGGPLTLVQIGIGILDLGCCAMAMYWLVPDEPHLGFIQVAVIFVAATLLGFASHAPGGLGVFDATMMVALWQFDKEDLLAGLLLFRLLYYIIPFMLSLLILGGREALLGRTVRRLAPPVTSVDALGRRAGAGKIGRNLIRLAARRLRGAVSMSLNDDRVALQRGGWRRLRLMIITAAAVFAALTILDALTIGYAVTGFIIVAAAAFVALRAGQEASPLARPVAVSERAGDPLQAVVAGLPDPVIALDRNGRVLTLNEQARSLAPALRQGEPVSLALRMPELIEAIGRAYATGEEQRVEYSERVPLDRWFETIVVPVKRQPNTESA